MKLFYLKRYQDVSGISGTGYVADGVIFPNGRCVICWRGNKSSVAVYDSIAMVESIHGHQGATKIVYEETKDS